MASEVTGASAAIGALAGVPAADEGLPLHDAAGSLGAVDLGEDIDDLRSLEEIARWFKVSEPTVRGWISRHGCPVVEGGSRGVAYKLSIRAVHDWRQGVKREQTAEAERRARQDEQLRIDLVGADGLALPAGADRALSARDQADALRAEVDRTRLAQMRGELVRADLMQFAVASAFKTVTDSIRRIPELVGAALGLPDDQVDRLIEETDKALEDLADMVAKLDPSKVAGDVGK